MEVALIMVVTLVVSALVLSFDLSGREHEGWHGMSWVKPHSFVSCWVGIVIVLLQLSCGIYGRRGVGFHPWTADPSLVCCVPASGYVV